MDKFRKKILIVLFSLFSLFLFSFVFGQELEVNYPEVGGIKPQTVETLLPQYVKYIFNFVILGAGLILFGALVYAGFLYLTSAGKPEKQKEAKERVTRSFLGIAILLASYIILTTINPQLVVFPLGKISQPELECGPQKPCPLGKECLAGKCIEAPPCEKDADCPPDYMCQTIEEIGKKACVYVGKNLISREIPLGLLIKKTILTTTTIEGVREETKNLAQILNPETDKSSQERISNINKKLKSLSDDCQCGNLQAQCLDGYGFSLSQYCEGDPCKNESENIDNLLKKNEKRMEDLLNAKTNIIQKKDNLEKDLVKIGRAMEETLDCLKEGRLLTYTQYITMKDKLGDIHATTVVYQELGKEKDPLTFYCLQGGDIFETYPLSLKEIPEVTLPEEIPEGGFTPLYCSVVIPLHKLLIEGIANTSNELLGRMGNLVLAIDELVGKISKMNSLVSKCKDQKCKPQCGCIPNILMPACAVMLLPCTTRLCLTSAPSCIEDPDFPPSCQRDEIATTSKEIYEIENYIFKEIEGIENKLSKLEELRDGKVGGEEIPLDAISLAFEVCRGPVLLGEEVPKTDLFTCPDVVREVPLNYNYGPGGELIAACYIWDFFCCSREATVFQEPSFPRFPRVFTQPLGLNAPDELKEVIIEPAPSETAISRATIPPQESSTSTIQGKTLFTLKQAAPPWGGMKYGREPFCTTYGAAGCGPSSLAMIISNFQGKAKSVDEVGQRIVEKGGRVCNSGTVGEVICQVAKENYGYPCQEINYRKSLEEIVECINGGGQILALMGGPSEFTQRGHFIVIVGFNGGKAVILDSSKRPSPREVLIDSVLTHKRQLWCIKKQ